MINLYPKPETVLHIWPGRSNYIIETDKYFFVVLIRMWKMFTEMFMEHTHVSHFVLGK